MRSIVLAVLAFTVVGCGGGKPPTLEIRNVAWTSERKKSYDYSSENMDEVYTTTQNGKAQVVCDALKGKMVQARVRIKMETDKKSENYSQFVELKDGLGELTFDIEGEKEPKVEFSGEGYLELSPINLIVK